MLEKIVLFFEKGDMMELEQAGAPTVEAE